MSVSGLRNLACWVMIAVVPASLWAADSSPAMLYARGAAWINGGAVPRTSAVFPGDLVQTRSDSVASINASGSNVVVLADSLVKFEGPAVALEHGSFAGRDLERAEHPHRRPHGCSRFKRLDGI